MSLQKMFDSMEDSCMFSANPERLVLNWTAKGVGFGTFYFYTKDGKLYCDNETMSKEFIKRMLGSMVDNTIMTEPNSKDTNDDKS